MNQLLLNFGRLLIGALSRTPVALQPAIVACLARVYFFRGRKDVARLYDNVAAVYQLPKHSVFARTFAKQVVRHQLNASLDLFTLLRKQELVSFSGMPEASAILLKLEAERQGLIVVTAHLGCWEFCAYTVAKIIGGKFSVLAKPAKNKLVTKLLEEARRRLRVEVLWTDRKSLLRDMLGALRSGNALGFVMDQKPEGRRGHLAQFFGVETAFVSGPAAMAVKTGAPVVTIFCLRTGPRAYRVIVDQVVVADEAKAMGEEALTKELARRIEAVVAAYPEQWTWNYKRWTSAELEVARPARANRFLAGDSTS